MRVVLRYRPRSDERPSSVEVLGEVSDWVNPIALERQDDGTFARAIELPPGVYQTKLRVDGAWRLDPDGGPTRAQGGLANDLLRVDAAPEPLLFAPGSPWVTPLERGGARVLFGVRRGADVPAVVRVTEDGGATWREHEAALAFEEDEHRFFVATIPTSAARARASVGGFEVDVPRLPPSERVPDWWRRAVIYGVFVDRFRPDEDHPEWEADPGKHAAAGGHLRGVTRSLDELADLGVDTVYLTPVHVGASQHRYDVVDPRIVDPALGGEEAYAELVREARARGMRIVQDVSFAHAGRGYPPYEAVLEGGRASPHAAQFRWKDGALVHYGKRTDAPLFDLDCPAVRAMALASVEAWARRGVSGLRLDMTAEVPIDLGREIRRRFRALAPDGVVLGEVVPAHAWRWLDEGVVDAATDFGFHEALGAIVCNLHTSPEDLARRIARSDLLRGGDATTRAVRFASTHDHPRLATLAAHHGSLQRLPLAYALLATMPGIPMLLYGEEVGMRSDGAGLEVEDVWPDRAPMPWTPASRDHALRGVVRDFLRARAGSPALREGKLEVLFVDAGTLIFRREAEGDVVDVAVSFDPEPKTVEIADDDHPRSTVIARIGAAGLSGSELHLPGYSAVAIRRERALGRAVSPAAARKNLALRDDDLRSGRVAAHARPSRFFFAVTERCNLSCKHCITHAPERTRTGTARTMSRAVIDALRPDFALADYFAFVHGGESLTAPALFEVLEAIREARGAEPWVAHLLTNGLLFGPRMAERLVRAGVSSVSVSLDGATADTNDAIREGGRFDEVVARLADVAGWVQGEGVDLRLGISYVILRQNLHELPALVELAVRIGVDWVKLEEAAPATPFAERSLVACDDLAVRAAVRRAIDLGRARGLVMVDHTIDRPLWRCALDEEARVNLLADEHANRGVIHPCRSPWETACVEPDGAVRALDFFGPLLGDVTRTPLAELWNGPDARLARERSMLARRCGPQGPVTCLDPPPDRSTT